MPKMYTRLVFNKAENARPQSGFATHRHYHGTTEDHGHEHETDHLRGRFHYWPPVKKCSIVFFNSLTSNGLVM
jgi:hypothetical protein